MPRSSRTPDHLVHILGSLPSAVLVEDEHRTVTFMNAAFRVMFGLDDSPEECDGHVISARQTPDPDAFLARVEALRTTRTLVEREVLHLTDGRALERDCIPVDANGKPAGILWQLRDVTRVWNASQRLMESRSRLGAVVEGALDSIIMADHHGRVVAFNASAERVFGWRRADAIGKNMAPLIMPDRYRSAHDRGMARYLRSGDARVLNKRLELTGQRADGTEFPVELTVIQVQGGDEPIFCGFLRDLSDASAARESLEQARDKAEETVRIHQDILAATRRQLRQSVHVATGMTELALEHNHVPRHVEQLQAALAHVVSLHGRIEALISRSEPAPPVEVELPVRLAQARAEPALSPGHRILALDDDADGLSYLNLIFERAGCTVTPLHSDAFGGVVDLDADLVVISAELSEAALQMLARRILERSQGGMPILALTTLTDPEAIDRCRAVGISGHLVKPALPGTILRAAAALLIPPSATPVATSADVAAPRVQVDEDLLHLVDEFITERRDDLPGLSVTLAAGQLDPVTRWAHQLTGSGASYGFPELSRLAAIVERHGHAGELEASRTAFDALSRYLRTVDWYG